MVNIHVPKFLGCNYRHHLVKASGDRLLNQVVRQVSKRLTRKVSGKTFTGLRIYPCPAATTATTSGRIGVKGSFQGQGSF